jgi:hypothetical protein
VSLSVDWLMCSANQQNFIFLESPRSGRKEIFDGFAGRKSLSGVEIVSYMKKSL